MEACYAVLLCWSVYDGSKQARNEADVMTCLYSGSGLSALFNLFFLFRCSRDLEDGQRTFSQLRGFR